MPRLVEALQVLGVEGRVAPSGCGVLIEGQGCRVLVVEASRGLG